MLAVVESFSNKTSIEVLDWALPLLALAACSLLFTLAWSIWNRHVKEDDKVHEKVTVHGEKIAVLESK